MSSSQGSGGFWKINTRELHEVDDVSLWFKSWFGLFSLTSQIKWVFPPYVMMVMVKKRILKKLEQKAGGISKWYVQAGRA